MLILYLAVLVFSIIWWVRTYDYTVSDGQLCLLAVITFGPLVALSMIAWISTPVNSPLVLLHVPWVVVATLVAYRIVKRREVATKEQAERSLRIAFMVADAASGVLPHDHRRRQS